MSSENRPEDKKPAALRVSAGTGVTGIRADKKRLALTGLLMLQPWLWVSLGLLVWQEFRVTMLLYLLLCCLLPFLLLRRPDVSFAMRGLRHRRLLWAEIILLNLAILAAFSAAAEHVFQWDLAQAHFQSIGLNSSLAVFWVFAGILVLLNPILEEAFWRGLVYHEWRRHLPHWQANIISSFFFGAWHWVILQYFCPPWWALGLTACVIIGGMVFAYLYEKTGSLMAGILLHALGADLPLAVITWQALQAFP